MIFFLPVYNMLYGAIDSLVISAMYYEGSKKVRSLVFVGLVTAGMRDLDVMVPELGGREYQIWQGRQGDFTRFVDHSCKADAQFQAFVWKGTQRLVLVSKGVEAGEEVAVDYSGRDWRGLDKRCLCGEACSPYNGERR